ncbi:tetratricopeptide repeat protein [Sulfuritalea hydrogenivorans]|jgi:cytochrome c-type biogenesis protein CcmH/NrfG|uniref:tetratricopeptide repeat protein n=1 Tax=Sulfuritalea hydrogenivorans TaxID=748811 RepID=UPI0006969BC4|nr:tetratricopeptide repeat protein [Sulfuritalea hydrogenivorans]MDK9712879.1 tetratricopeptide repeat protein [Sulfuritalea sp.]
MARNLNWRAAPFLACLPLLAACATADLYELHQSAVLAYDSGEDARAEALYQGLARSAPNDPETWLRLGNLYARSNRPDKAAEAYERGLLLAPSDARLWYNLGIIRQRQAHASFIAAHQYIDDADPLQARTKAMIERLAPAVAEAAPAAEK